MKNIKTTNDLSGPETDWSLGDEFIEPETRIDQHKIGQAILMIIEAIGEDPAREGLRDTPARVGRMYAEIFAGLHQNPADVLSTRFHVEQEEIVLVRDIPFYSMCEHHLLPFFGVAHVAYLPQSGTVTGLSKLARLVDMVAKRPQVQERMTNQVADILDRELKPKGTFAMVEAEHLCMSMRGIQKPGSRTITTASRGVVSSDPAMRAEIIRTIR